jgi:hypothetical protein
MKLIGVLLLLLVLATTVARQESRGYNNDVMKTMTGVEPVDVHLRNRVDPDSNVIGFGKRSRSYFIGSGIQNQAFEGGYGNRPEADA